MVNRYKTIRVKKIQNKKKMVNGYKTVRVKKYLHYITKPFGLSLTALFFCFLCFMFLVLWIPYPLSFVLDFIMNERNFFLLKKRPQQIDSGKIHTALENMPSNPIPPMLWQIQHL